MPGTKKHIIAIQNVNEDLWQRVLKFLQTHKRVPSISAVAKAALENYLDQSERYGIDVDWKPNIPKPQGGGGMPEKLSSIEGAV